MKSLKTILVSCLLVLGAFSVGAQDIHFSQFYMSPLNLNPAMTGVMNSNVRLVANYRNQWASVLREDAFRTYSVSYDQRIAAGRYDYFGIGGSFWGDRAGQANFSTLTGKISASYSKRMGGTRDGGSYLVVGAEAGVAQRSIDFLELRWGNQHDGFGGFDPNLASGETNFDRDNFLFADLAAGLMWFNVIDEQTNYYVGAAFHHLNRADQSFISEEQRTQLEQENQIVPDEDLIFSRYTIHAGAEFPLNEKITLLPGAIVMSQGPSFQVNAGTSFKFWLNQRPGEQQAFQLGLWGRMASELDAGVLTDAVIMSTRFDFNQFSIGFSYDINLSDLNVATNNQGAFEFGLIYKISGMQRRNVYCPNF